jgi:penicillin-insensitive murein DD-endopeptidase
MHLTRLHLMVSLGLVLVVPAGLRAAEPNLEPNIDPKNKAPAPVEVRRAAPATAVKAVPVPQKAGPKKDAAKHAAPKADGKHGKKGVKTAKKKKEEGPPAKVLFSAVKSAAALAPRAIGWYAKGCLAGGVQLPDTGPEWQTMRLSRNRAWGHPKLVRLVKRLAAEAKQYDGWPGLLVGDLAQPRGGPMITGHASHQVGLDADIWLNPMPDRVLTAKEREDISAVSMLDKTSLAVDPKIFTPKHVALLKRAASYREVERIFVHPAIKKALCTAAGKDRRWLAKVRPIWGHNYHFHIRMGCPNSGCQVQAPVHGEDGCGKEVENWLKSIAKSLKAKPEPKTAGKWIPPSERRKITMEQLPPDCRVVLNSPDATAVAADAKPSTGSLSKQR